MRNRTTTIRTAATIASIAALALTACGSDEPAAAPVTQPEETQPEETQPEETQPDVTQPDVTVPEPTQPDGTQPDEQPAAVAAAIADLVERTGRSESEIEVARFESVTWSDGSIGCPEPGMSYTQALVPGFRIELVVDATSYWYHGARDGDPFWCATPSDPVAGEAGDR
jgi:hypothetical protein